MNKNAPDKGTIPSHSSQSAGYAVIVISLGALLILCIAWEWLLAPLRPGGSWMTVKALPLLIPLRGIIKRDIYTLQWSAMLVLLYFIEGCVRAFSETGLSAKLAALEILLVSIFFVSVLRYLRPYKQAAKRTLTP